MPKRLTDLVKPLPRSAVCYRVQITLDGILVTSEPFYSPLDAVTAARALSARSDDHEATILDERGRLVAWFGWTGPGDDATPKVRANHIARADVKLVDALTAQDVTCFGTEA